MSFEADTCRFQMAVFRAKIVYPNNECCPSDRKIDNLKVLN